MEPIRVTFRFTRNDSIRFIRAQLLKRWLVRLVIVLAVAWLAFDLWTFVSQGTVAGEVFWPTAFIVLIGILLPFIGPNLLVYFSQSGVEPPEVSWIFTESGIHLDAPSVQDDHDWNHFSRVERDRTFYYFYVGSSIGAVLPRRVLDPERQNAVEKLLKDKLTVNWK